MDRHLLPTLLLVVILIASTVYGKENTDDLSCPEHQLNFEGSCYEFVTQQHSFLSAQKWCEQGGGHLAFIKDDITQRFLQAHLLPEENWWFGLAYTSFNQDSSEGPVSWLDGSHVSFSNWHNEPILDKGCGYMMKDSGFQWVTTSNCSQQFFFICEFELGHALACKDHNAMLMCGSGQVIRIDDSFYGRKTEHYCRANHSLEPASAQQVCSWLDVLDSVSESCDGLQMCEVSANVTSYGEPCPRLTSYLSVKYHCEEGNFVYCGDEDGMRSLYLPKGFYELNITAKNKAKQTIINTVTDIVVTSILSLQPIVQANVSATVLAQLFQGITDYINKQIYVEPAVKAQRNVFDSILTVLDNVHSSLLKYKTPGGEPAIINTPLINVYANRLLPAHFKDTYEVKIDNESAGFVLPTVFSKLLPAQVDVRMLSLKVNPYEWSEGEEISSVVGGLSLTNLNGSVIPVKNLNEEIEILLPRLNGENISSTFLDLRNYSTMAINVSNPGTSLVLKLEPLYKTDLVLLLGFEYHPNDTKYLVKTKMPQSGSTEEERYTWVVGSNYISKEGVYYLLVRPVVPPGINSTNASVSVTSVAVNCKFWRDKKANWSNSGCRVGPRSTPQVTQCLCTHLTFFGSSFFVMPNTVDVSRTAELFSTFSNNPVVVCFVGAIILVYILAVIWARRKDLQDKIKVKVTVLEDNDPLAEYRYLVAVATGYRRGAATTSNVTLMLKGTVWESKPHHLTDPEKKVFTRGGVDLFLLTTPFSVGEVEGVRLWHDNSGEYPDWYVNKVVVYDLETGEKWQFLCNSWLSVDMGECTLDKTFYIATEADLKGFHNLFFTKTAKDLCDGHIWYSVLNRPAHSSFTRVQRLSCCFSLLLCTMLTSLMFWGIPASPAEQDTELGSIKFNWQQIMVGIQSSIIMFPVNLLIVTIFRFTRPRQKSEPKKQTKSDSIKKKKKCTDNFLDLCIKKEVTMELIIKDLKRILRYLAKIVHCPTPNAALDSEPTDIITLVFLLEDFIRQQNFGVGRFYIDDIQMDRFSMYRKFLYKQVLNLEKQLKLLGPSSFPKPEGYITTLMQVQGMKHVLEPYLSVPDPVVTDGVDDDNKGKKKCCANGLPWWFVFVGWILVLASSGVSAYFTMMYGLTYGKERSINWLISISVSFFESLFVTQPLKVLGFAVFFALVVKSINEEEINYFQLLKDMKLTYTDDPDDVRISRRDSTCIYYQPPPLSEIEKMKINRIKNQKAFALIWEIIIYLAFLCVLLVATYGQRDPNAYFLTQHIEQSFSSGIADSMGPKDVFNWINSSVLSNIFGVNPGFITDGNSKLVGSARIRQVRVRKDSCKIPNHMRPSIPDCHAPYSRDVEDRGSYSTGWNQSISVNISQPFLMPWVYQTQSTLRGHPIWGNVGFYRGGGYVLDLGLDEDNARSMLLDLFENTWLDTYTRAFFVEFTVYNANVNLFCIVTLMLETTAVGAFQYRSELHNLRLYQATEGVNVVASEVIYFLFILYYMFVQAKRIKQQKCSYFKSKLNLLEMAIIFLSWSAAGAIINRTVQGDQDLKYFQEHKDHFPSFYDTATADDVLGYILAFLILLATVKMWHLMRLNSKLNLITCTLQRAWNDISSFIVVITIMFLAYSVVSNLLFGWKLYTYKTLQDAALAVVGLQLGTFNYDEVLDLNPVLGAFIVGSCIIFMTFVVLNLFISVILEAFSEEQKQHQPSEEEEIVDLMIVKICKMFGIKIKKKQ
ncbi:polycystin-1-like protein 2 [Trichomycterus rosablanca]|uniref:polycystin-1-like protein 2 n=1 Tax=Trichomycterus rosablanca TaxID=2290929 RepID=UPI002F34F62E